MKPVFKQLWEMGIREGKKEAGETKHISYPELDFMPDVHMLLW